MSVGRKKKINAKAWESKSRKEKGVEESTETKLKRTRSKKQPSVTIYTRSVKSLRRWEKFMSTGSNQKQRALR